MLRTTLFRVRKSTSVNPTKRKAVRQIDNAETKLRRRNAAATLDIHTQLATSIPESNTLVLNESIRLIGTADSDSVRHEPMNKDDEPAANPLAPDAADSLFDSDDTYLAEPSLISSSDDDDSDFAHACFPRTPPPAFEMDKQQALKYVSQDLLQYLGYLLDNDAEDFDRRVILNVIQLMYDIEEVNLEQRQKFLDLWDTQADDVKVFVMRYLLYNCNMTVMQRGESRALRVCS
ncbi:uncharacterized protein V1518DRAFT_419298 [Limtongia smithiae]|uniref:uncharacterized protein n=1 Tax=Limtongia smithiae TaxID=1125753 RepID=UPI0034CDE2C3